MCTICSQFSLIVVLQCIRRCLVKWNEAKTTTTAHREWLGCLANDTMMTMTTTAVAKALAVTVLCMHHASWCMFGAVFCCTCKNKSFHVCTNRSSRIRFGRALLICLWCCFCCCHFPCFYFVQDVYAVIFTHAMPTAFVKCQKKQIISTLDRILLCVLCMRAGSTMLTDSFFFQWALSLFFVEHFVLFRWWSVFRTVDADTHSMEELNATK